MKILEVEGLGWPAALVEIENEPVLLINSTLDQDERVEVMLDAMNELDLAGGA